MKETLITRENGSIVKPPTFQYGVGDRFAVCEEIDFHINGTKQKVPTLYYEIVSRSREYVTNEDEWYVDYQVSFVDSTENQIKKLSLTESDIKNDGYKKTDKLVVELVEKATQPYPMQ